MLVIGGTAVLDAPRGRADDSSCTTWTRRDLPIPASPLSTTMWPRPAWTWAQRSRRSPTSGSRPTSGVRPRAPRRRSAAVPRLTQDLIDLQGFGDAFEGMGPQGGQVKYPWTSRAWPR